MDAEFWDPEDGLLRGMLLGTGTLDADGFTQFFQQRWVDKAKSRWKVLAEVGVPRESVLSMRERWRSVGPLAKLLHRELHELPDPLGPFCWQLLVDGVVDAPLMRQTLVDRKQLADRGVRVNPVQILIDRDELPAEQFLERVRASGQAILQCTDCGAHGWLPSFSELESYICDGCMGVLGPLQGGYLDSAVAQLVGNDSMTEAEPKELVGGHELGQLLLSDETGELYSDAGDDGRLIRVLRLPDSPDKSAHRQWRKLQLALRQLRDPHLIVPPPLGTDGDLSFLALSVPPGSPLDGHPTPPREADAVRLVRDLTRAVCVMHRSGVAHGAIRPGAVWVPRDRSRPASLLALGDALQPGVEGRLSPYPAPPAAEGATPEQLAIADDICALGSVLITLLTGQPPGAAPAELPETWAEALGRPLERSLGRGPDPFTRATELLTALQRALGETGSVRMDAGALGIPRSRGSGSSHRLAPGRSRVAHVGGTPAEPRRVDVIGWVKRNPVVLLAITLVLMGVIGLSMILRDGGPPAGGGPGPTPAPAPTPAPGPTPAPPPRPAPPTAPTRKADAGFLDALRDLLAREQIGPARHQLEQLAPAERAQALSAALGRLDPPQLMTLAAVDAWAALAQGARATLTGAAYRDRMLRFASEQLLRGDLAALARVRALAFPAEADAERALRQILATVSASNIERLLRRAAADRRQDWLGRQLGQAMFAQSPQRAAQLLAETKAQGFSDAIPVQAAVDAWTLYISLRPRDFRALVNRGLLYRELAQDDLAMADVERVLKLQPGEAVALNNRGLILRDQGKYEDALKDFDRAIASSEPTSRLGVLLRVNRGLAFLLADQPRRALKDFELASQSMHSEYLQLQVLLARAATGDDDAARAGLPAVLARVPAQILVRTGPIRCHLILADRLVRLLPRHPLAWAERGAMRLRLRQTEAAAQDLRKALSLAQGDPGHAGLVTLITQLLKKAGG